MKKIVLIMLISVFFLLGAAPACAEVVNNSTFAAKIVELQKTFVEGEYWNYYSSSDYSRTGTHSCYCSGYCSGDCSCRCGQFYYNGIWYGGQCHGYALKLGNLIFGDNPAAWSTHSNTYDIVAGDIVRAKFTSAGLHTIFVYKVIDETVYFTDCNFVGPCEVRWNGTYTKSQIAGKSNLTIYHASNNSCTTGTNDLGSEMSVGYDRVLPDGDYIIATGSYIVRFKIIQDDGSTISSDAVRVPWTISYSFKSWNMAANGSGTSYNPGATYTDNASVTLYAQWNSTKSTVPVQLPDSPTRKGYVFMGWATTKTATSGMFGSYTPTCDGDVTLYPTWKIMDVILPAALTEIGNEAFENCGAAAVTIPSGCTTIGSRAFADNPSLVYIFIPASVTQIANDAFVDCPNVTIYCYSGSIAATYAAEQSIRYVLLSDDWVLAEEVPLGATVTEEKWTYQKSTTETMTSTDPNADGWTQAGFE